MNEREKIDNLKAILNQVNERDLRTFCKLQNIQLPQDATKKEIIEILTESPPNGFEGFLGNAFRLELRSTESNMLDAIEHKAEDLAASAQKSIDAVEERAALLANAASENIASAVKSVEGVKWLLGGVGTALGIMITILGIFSYRKIGDLDTEIKKAAELRTTMDALRDQSANMLVIHRRHMINQWIEGIDNVMEGFSTSLPDEKLLSNFLTYRDSINQMVALSHSDPVTPEETVLLRIRNICQALNSVSEWSKVDKVDPNDSDWETKAAASERDWNQMGLATPSPGTLGSFLARSNAFRSNALGIISLKRYKRNQQRVLDDLDNAGASFADAVKHDKTYGRAYGNQGVVYYYKFLRSEDSNERRKLIAEAIASHIKSSRYPERSGSGRSRTFNNIAAYLLLEASLYEQEDPVKAKAKLREAENEIAKALEQESFVSTVYVTKAEIASLKLHLEESEGNAKNPSEAGRILELAKLAADKGFRCEKKKDLPFLGLMKSGYPAVLDEIYTVLHCPNE